MLKSCWVCFFGDCSGVSTSIRQPHAMLKLQAIYHGSDQKNISDTFQAFNKSHNLELYRYETMSASIIIAIPLSEPPPPT